MSSGSWALNEVARVDELARIRAQESPDCTAVFHVDTGRRVSFKELEDCVQVLSAAISRRSTPETDSDGLSSGRFVVSAVDEGVHFVPSVLAIMRAQCVYVPIDSAIPEERLRSVVEDCLAQMKRQAKLLVLTMAGPPAMDLRRKLFTAGSQLSERVDVCDVESLVDESVVVFDGPGSQQEVAPVPIESESGVTPANGVSHIIYTSGSMGRPKGVVCSHKALLQYSATRARMQGIDRASRILLTSAHVWDPMLGDLATSLFSRAVLCICPRALLVCNFLDMLVASRPTHVACTPSLWGLLGTGDGVVIPKSVRVVSLGGEVMSQEVLDHWSSRVTLLNTYGVTEATVYQTCHECKPGDDPRCAGPSIPGVALGVLRGDHIYTSLITTAASCGVCERKVVHNLAPGQGELVLSGQLADGYFNDPNLTKEKFVRGSDGCVWYCSGDLAAISKQGRVNILGRLDNQIKLNGFRIELGAIESAVMRSSTLVSMACALVHDHKLWCVVSGACDEWSALPDSGRCLWKDSACTALHATCSLHLLPHERPVGFLWRGRFPLTPGGKMCRQSLQKWAADEIRGIQHLETGSPQQKERTEKLADGIESIIAHVWSEVLGVDRKDMSPASHFFFLGGNSALAVAMLNKVKERLSITGKDADADKVRWCGLYRRPWLRDFSTVVMWSLAPSPNADGGVSGFVQQQTGVYEDMFELEKAMGSMAIGAEGRGPEIGSLATACSQGMILTARRGWVLLLSGLLDIHASLNVCIDGAVTHKNKVEVSPLMAACFAGELDTASLLVSAGAKVNTFTAQGLGPAHSAIHGAGRCTSQCEEADCHIRVLQFLLDHGAVTECRDINRWTLLHHAAWYGVLGAVRELVDRGADIDSKDKWKRTPLSWAFYNKRVGVVHYLISKGAKVDSVVREGDRPRKQPQLSHLKRTKNHWSTSFHLAIQPGMQGGVGEGGPSEEARLCDEDTVLELVKLIVSTGHADINQPDADGKTPRELASSLGYSNVVKYLEECSRG